jgi:hypothetical protein
MWAWADCPWTWRWTVRGGLQIRSLFVCGAMAASGACQSVPRRGIASGRQCAQSTWLPPGSASAPGPPPQAPHAAAVTSLFLIPHVKPSILRCLARRRGWPRHGGIGCAARGPLGIAAAPAPEARLECARPLYKRHVIGSNVTCGCSWATAPGRCGARHKFVGWCHTAAAWGTFRGHTRGTAPACPRQHARVAEAREQLRGQFLN